MELRQLEYVVALAEEGQFTRAADLVRISQSGLSAAIRGLESELGCRLFERTTRKVELTQAGQALLPFARSILAQAAAARDAVVRASQEISGRLRVGAEQCLGVVDVAALLERFRDRHPGVEIQFTQAGSEELLGHLRGGKLDVAFVAGASHVGALSRTVLGRDTFVVLLPPGHRLRGRTWLDRADVADEGFVDFHSSWAVRQLNDAAFDAAGIARRVTLAVNDVHTLLNLVSRGMGIAIVPRHVAAKPQAADLVAVPLRADVGPGWTVALVAAGSERADSPAPHFVDLVHERGLVRDPAEERVGALAAVASQS